LSTFFKVDRQFMRLQLFNFMFQLLHENKINIYEKVAMMFQ
jgi:hypothetical protein